MKRALAALCLLTLPLAALGAGTETTASARTTFTDVPPDAWFAAYVQQASDDGIVGGYADAQGNATGTFGPADSVTIEQAIKMAVKAAGYDLTRYAPVTEDGQDAWFAPYAGL